MLAWPGPSEPSTNGNPAEGFCLSPLAVLLFASRLAFIISDATGRQSPPLVGTSRWASAIRGWCYALRGARPRSGRLRQAASHRPVLDQLRVGGFRLSAAGGLLSFAQAVHGATMRLRNEISIAVGDRTIRGWYVTKRGMVTVTSEFGSKTSRIGSLSPESLARTMLRELLDHDEQRKRLAVREED
jgi:hypothetical protein